ncbi:MAG: helix-turn-helix transcriptional regulator [Candidatus Thiodiazotropha sp. (ex Epidulcina cf. delphinae)]|nr:helix-turn-helix transcriptional regulator [Candidatus Thiodiazotropha sp. (ex Epidulcina cf. delphinae)]
MISQLDIFFRIGNTVLLVLLAMVLIKDHYRRPSAVLGAIIALGAAAIGTFEYTLEWGWLVLEIPLNLFCAAAPVAFWLLSKSLFEDAFQWKWSYLLVYVVFAASGLIGHYITFGDLRGMVHWVMRSDVSHNGLALIPLVLMGITLVVLAMYHALKDWRIDLVESRRRARMASVLLGGVVILVITFAEFFNLGTPRSILVSTIVSGFFFLLILGIYLHFLGFRRGQPDQPLPLEIPSQRSIEVDVEEGDAPGAEIIEELERLMVEKRLFCEEGLTIGRLAERLEIKEYLLRRMINGHLGYRNYNQFLNRYRIEEAAKLLLAPKTRHLPVLTIALDVGYRSLTVFNKAFKETMNMTPSEFRKCRKAETPLVD